MSIQEIHALVAAALEVFDQLGTKDSASTPTRNFENALEKLVSLCVKAGMACSLEPTPEEAIAFAAEVTQAFLKEQESQQQVEPQDVKKLCSLLKRVKAAEKDANSAFFKRHEPVSNPMKASSSSITRKFK